MTPRVASLLGLLNPADAARIEAAEARRRPCAVQGCANAREVGLLCAGHAGELGLPEIPELLAPMEPQ